MKVLNVGCGPRGRAHRFAGFADWQEVRLDIDPAVKPDVVGTMTDMSAVASKSMEAIVSSHNIEHLYPHEVPLALAEFVRVLTDDGMVLITCPDLKSVSARVAQGELASPLYTSAAGPISALDILYGHRDAMAAGNLYMAHRCGFTLQLLADTLRACGFPRTVGIARPAFWPPNKLCLTTPCVCWPRGICPRVEPAAPPGAQFFAPWANARARLAARAVSSGADKSQPCMWFRLMAVNAAIHTGLLFRQGM